MHLLLLLLNYTINIAFCAAKEVGCSKSIRVCEMLVLKLEEEGGRSKSCTGAVVILKEAFVFVCELDTIECSY